MALGTIDTKMEMSTMVSGSKIIEMDKGLCNIIMALSTKEAGRKESNKEEASSILATATHMMGSGFVARCMAKECSFVRVRLLKSNGRGVS